jgi:hypothetical protein
MKGFTWLDVKANIELAAIKLKQNWHDKKLFIDKVLLFQIFYTFSERQFKSTMLFK